MKKKHLVLIQPHLEVLPVSLVNRFPPGYGRDRSWYWLSGGVSEDDNAIVSKSYVRGTNAGFSWSFNTDATGDKFLQSQFAVESSPGEPRRLRDKKRRK